MFTEDLRPDMMVTFNGYVVRLADKVTTIEGRDYWNCYTLFTDTPEYVMLAFPHHATVCKLHTQRA